MVQVDERESETPPMINPLDVVGFTDDTNSRSPNANKSRSHNTDGAPSYSIQNRQFGAVDVPMVVLNLERAKKAFGRTPSFPDILEPNRNSLQFYLNPDSPFLPPILSHNAATHNIVLKVTVPKRTGRRRKKDSNGPWKDSKKVNDELPPGATENNKSHGRLDHPKTLRRRLQDNVDKYSVEAVGLIKHTHRYKGLADFSWEATHSDFTQRFTNDVLTGDLSKIKSFSFIPGLDRRPNADIIPPPAFTHMTLPFNYNYEQNPYVRAVRDEEGEERVMNITAAVMVGHFVKPTVDQVPTCPRMPPDLTDPVMAELMEDLDIAFTERPIWTRRSLLNRLGNKIKSWNILKKYISYSAYQFKGGPFKDAVIAYGVDPRKDPKYRIYQTMFFKLPFVQIQKGADSRSWHAIRKGQQLVYVEDVSESHIFDGQTFYSNGKLWQVCDITDPLLAKMFTEASVRPTCDITGSGWFHQGLWAKAKAIMKCKLLAIRFNRQIDNSAFDVVQAMRDETPPPGTYISIKVPALNLTDEELRVLRGNRYKNNNKRRRLVRRELAGPKVAAGGGTDEMVVDSTEVGDDIEYADGHQKQGTSADEAGNDSHGMHHGHDDTQMGEYPDPDGEYLMNCGGMDGTVDEEFYGVDEEDEDDEAEEDEDEEEEEDVEEDDNEEEPKVDYQIDPRLFQSHLMDTDT